MSERFSIFSGSANPELAGAVAGELGVALGACTFERFPDSELSVRLEESVRRRDVYIVQPTAPPVNERVAELLLMADACRRAAAGRIVAVVPYFGYARSDRRQGHRAPITASLVAELLTIVGVDHVITVDLHAPQIEGFFHIPVDDLSAVPRLAAALHHQIPADAVVVSPDLGGLRRATAYAQRLGLPAAVCHKQRLSGTVVKVAQVIGDVRGRGSVIVDDMITTGGTIVECARALVEAGARPEFTVAATHGVLVENAPAKLAAAGVRTLFVTDTIALPAVTAPQMSVVSIAPLLARAIGRLQAGESLRELA